MTEPPHLLFSADASLRRRERRERLAKGVLFGCASLSIVILAVLLVRLTLDGINAFSLDFFTSRYSPSKVRFGTAGIADAVFASGYMLLLTMLVAVPIGVSGAIWLNEYAGDNRFKRFIESWIANLAGVPSVVYGLLGLAIFVRLMQLGSNILTASLTMAILILPIIIVSSQEALKAVPKNVREASFGLGATRWQTVRSHVLPYAMPGILTGNILALSRAAGETAPLLVIQLPVYFTLLGFAPTDPGTPLQLRIYFLAQDARVTAHELAAGAVIVLVAATLLMNLAAIVLRHRIGKRTRW